MLVQMGEEKVQLAIQGYALVDKHLAVISQQVKVCPCPDLLARRQTHALVAISRAELSIITAAGARRGGGCRALAGCSSSGDGCVAISCVSTPLPFQLGHIRKCFISRFA